MFDTKSIQDIEENLLIEELQRRALDKLSKKRGDKIKEKILTDKNFDQEASDNINHIIEEHKRGDQLCRRLPTVEITKGVILDIFVYDINGNQMVVKVVTKSNDLNLDVDIIT